MEPRKLEKEYVENKMYETGFKQGSRVVVNVLEEGFVIGAQSHTSVRGAKEKRIRKAVGGSEETPTYQSGNQFIQKNKWAWEGKLVEVLQETVAFV